LSDKLYYSAYEERYQKVFQAGVKLWGHSPDDEVLISTLEKWVYDNNLQGKRVLEFACGEGACGVILSKLGCIYSGVDIAPSALEKSKKALKDFPYAMVTHLDMVNETINDCFDAALDVMGLHMLVTDSDRESYLKNAYASLGFGSPMLFFRESYRVDAYDGKIDSFEEWKIISGSDYETPEKRQVRCGDKDIEVFVPLVPARAMNRAGYINEMLNAGFAVEDFMEMDMNCQCSCSASIFVRKL
jgi:hypothetical protein